MAEQAFQMLLTNDIGSEEESDTEDIDEDEEYGNEAVKVVIWMLLKRYM